MTVPAMRELPPPGIYPHVLPAHYHGWPCASNSRLLILEQRSPAHVRASMREESKAAFGGPGTKLTAMGLGSAIHAAALEPQNFDAWYRLRPEGSANSNAFKAQVAKIMADHPWATILHGDDYDTCRRVAEAVRSHPVAGELIAAASPASPGAELTIVWKDATTGVTCKGRIDVPVPDVGLADLKSCDDASAEAFGKKATNLLYWRQGAMYLMGASEVGLHLPANVLLIAAEKQDPWGVAVYSVPSKWLTRGEAEVEALLERWAACERSDHWPSYSSAITSLQFPAWAEKRLDEPFEIRRVA